jgi:hypothetical protein
MTDKKLLLGVGLHAFVPPVLARYREQVQDKKRGAELEKVAATLAKRGYELGGETYKKTPKGIPADHPRAALLRHSGLYSSWEGKHPKELGSPGFVDFVAARYKELLPLHQWLAGMNE